MTTASKPVNEKNPSDIANPILLIPNGNGFEKFPTFRYSKPIPAKSNSGIILPNVVIMPYNVPHFTPRMFIKVHIQRKATATAIPRGVSVNPTARPGM